MILIMSDGKLFDGGFATISFNIYNKLANYERKIVHLIFSKHHEVLESKFPFFEYVNVTLNKINIDLLKHDKKKLIDYIGQLNNKKLDVLENEYKIIICLSPKSLFYASALYPNTPIIYIKAGLGFYYNIPKLLDHCKNNNLYNFGPDHFNEFMCKHTISLEDQSVIYNKKIKFFNTSKLVTHVISRAIDLGLYKNVTEKHINELPFIHITKGNVNNIQKKKYDLIFVTNDHQKLVKNSDFVLNIFNRLPNYKKIVIGKNSDKYNNCPNTEILNFIDNGDLLNIFSQTKILVLPSLYEASPNVVIEAISNNCMTIMSKNSGYSEYVLDKYVIDNFDPDQWINRIEHHLQRDFDTKDFSNIMNLIDISDYNLDSIVKTVIK